MTSNAATAASTASSYWASVALYVDPAGAFGSAGFSTMSGSGDSTHRPARKIGCGVTMVVVVILGSWRSRAGDRVVRAF